MLGGHVFHLVRLIEYDEIISEEHATFDVFIQATEQSKKKRVIDHQRVGRKNAMARPLEKTDIVLFGEFRWKTAKLRRAQPAFRTDLSPNLRVWLNIKVRQAAIGRFFGPLV